MNIENYNKYEVDVFSGTVNFLQNTYDGLVERLGRDYVRYFASIKNTACIHGMEDVPFCDVWRTRQGALPAKIEMLKQEYLTNIEQRIVDYFFAQASLANSRFNDDNVDVDYTIYAAAAAQYALRKLSSMVGATVEAEKAWLFDTNIARASLAVGAGVTVENGEPARDPYDGRYYFDTVAPAYGLYYLSGRIQPYLGAITWEWTHTNVKSPLPEHTELDGRTYTDSERPIVLANVSSWIAAPYFFVGDHKGCQCVETVR